MVSTAADATPGGPAGELVEIGLSHIFKVITELAGELGDIPEHISQFKLDRLPGDVIEHTTVVAQHLFHLVGHLSGFTGQAKRRINRILTSLGIGSCAAGLGLIGVELHGHGLQTPGW